MKSHYLINVSVKLILFVFLIVTFFYTEIIAETRPLTRIIVLGDSLVSGFGVDRKNSFPRQLEFTLSELSKNIKVINAGVSGDTTTGGLSRIEWVLEEKVDIVIIVLGSNDMLRGIPPEIVRNNLNSIINILKNKNIKILLCGMKASKNLGKNYTTLFDKLYLDLAEKHNIDLYPFFLEQVALNPKYNQDDLMHPNEEGVKIIVKKILPYVLKLLN
ncbi:arylesterase [Alphaproteobacteria bacterium]|nr:arylesterase [Alphaproteobacteria bacterium]